MPMTPDEAQDAFLYATGAENLGIIYDAAVDNAGMIATHLVWLRQQGAPQAEIRPWVEREREALAIIAAVNSQRHWWRERQEEAETNAE